MTTTPPGQTQISGSALAYLDTMNQNWESVKVNDGGNFDRPPEGTASAIITKMEIKDDKVRIGGKQGEEKACVTVTFHYKQPRDKQAPDYNPKKGDFYEFPGSRITLLPGFERLPQDQQTRFSLDAGRLKNFIQVLLQIPEGTPCPLPAEGLRRIEAMLGEGRTIMVELNSSYRADKNDPKKTYYSDNLHGLIAG